MLERVQEFFITRSPKLLRYCAYAALPKYVLNSDNMWSGNVNGVVIPQERSIDIDNEFDFNLAKILINDEFSINQSNNSKL